MLGEIVQAEENLLLQSAKRHLEAGNLALAGEEAVRLLARHPDETSFKEAHGIQNRAIQTAREAVADGLEKFKAEKMDEKEVEKALSVYHKVIGSSAKDEFYSQSRNTLETTSLSRKLDDTMKRFREKIIDEQSLAKELSALQTQYPNNPAPSAEGPARSRLAGPEDRRADREKHRHKQAGPGFDGTRRSAGNAGDRSTGGCRRKG